MNALKVFTKDPSAKLLYGLDWTDYLAEFSGVSISTSSWSVTEGPDALLLVTNLGFLGASTSVRVTDGTLGREYTLTNHVVLTDGQEEQRSIKISVRDR